MSTLECGVELVGTEVKSVRDGRMHIRDAFARVMRTERGGKRRRELMLLQSHISPHGGTAGVFNHEPERQRRLLAHRREIRRLEVQQEQQGFTLVPLRCYFDVRGRLKVLLAVARGRQVHDKREAMKRRDDERNVQRALKQLNVR